MSNSFGSGVAKLLSGRIATQLVNFVTAPIISRLFLPQYFGARQIFISISGITVSISSLRYELTIPLGKDKKETVSSFILSISLTVIFSLLSLVLVFFLNEKAAEWLKTPELSLFLWLLPLSIFIGGIGNALRYYASRLGKFGFIAISDFVSISFGFLINISWVFILKASSTGLFTGYIVGILLGFILLFMLLARGLLADIKVSGVDLKSIWSIAKDFKKFPIFDTWSTLLNTVSIQLPVFILGVFYTNEIIGYYSQGQKIIWIPMSMLGGSIAQVFFPLAAKEYNEKSDLSEIVKSTFKRLCQIGIFPIMTIAFLGAPIFSFFLGKGWFEAGIYAQILSVFFLFGFFSSILSFVFDILRRQGTILIFNIGLIILRSFGIILGAWIGGPRTSLGIYSLFSTIGDVVMLIWILRNSSVSLKGSIFIFSKYLLLSCFLLPAFLVSFYGLGMIYIIALVFLAYVAYVCFLYFFDFEIHNYILLYMRKLMGYIKVLMARTK